MKCSSCNNDINGIGGEPYLPFKNIVICSQCYIDIIPEIYRMSGMGDGGLVDLVFKDTLKKKKNKNVR